MYADGNGVARDPTEAVKWYRVAASKGCVSAEYNLGGMYRYGQGVTKDPSEAVKWYRKAAEQGNASAQSILGFMYDNGEGITEDASEAVKWYRKAANQQDAAAQFNLGLMYWEGRGVTRNVVQAAKWFRAAGEQGVAPAQFNLGLMHMTGTGVTKDSTSGVKWFHMAAEQGYAPAQSNLAVAYDNGIGIVKDSTEAARWYRKAAEQGDASAQFAVASMYATGTGVVKDKTEAAKWNRMAADQGHAVAQFNLGVQYNQGDGDAKDNFEAVRWYRKAAEQGNASAQGNLGSMYANGIGVPKDAIEGLAWSNIAAASGDKIFIQNREMLERRVGPAMTLAAQHRSKEILREIEATKQRSASTGPTVTSKPISPTDETFSGSGSGAIVSPSGHVLTAAHVVAGAKRVRVRTANGMMSANVLRIDEANDLAVLKLTEGKYSALPVAPSRKVRLGQAVATIGFPNTRIQGFSPKVTRGEINSLNGVGDDPRTWQISAPVQPGSSGGPLLDESGNLVGVVVSKLGLKAAAATGDLPQNVNYAVKSAYAQALLEPFLGANAPEPSTQKRPFEDMVAKAQQSVVLILVY
jgi:TPR repeat protein